MIIGNPFAKTYFVNTLPSFENFPHTTQLSSYVSKKTSIVQSDPNIKCYTNMDEVENGDDAILFYCQHRCLVKYPSMNQIWRTITMLSDKSVPFSFQSGFYKLYPNWSVLKELDNELSVQNNISS
jgi:hypothetical protein